MSHLEDEVITRIRQREQRGQEKYGVGMDRTDLSFLDWLQHLQDELLDAAIYVERLKSEVDASKKR